MDEMNWMPMIVSLGFFAMIVWIVWLGTNAKNRRAQAQAEVQTKLIERFGSAKEFIEFLQSPAGRQFVTGVEVTSNLYAKDRIVSGFERESFSRCSASDSWPSGSSTKPRLLYPDSFCSASASASSSRRCWR